MRKQNIFLILLILFCSFVFSQPPGQTLGDLQIVYPKQDIIALEENHTFHVHVYNSINQLLNVANYDCYIHIYNVYGNHEVQEIMLDDSNGIDKKFLFNTSVHNDAGWHSYNIFCNTTSETGAASESFLSNIGGTDTTNSNNSFTGLYLIIGFGLIAFISLFSSGYVSDKKLEGVKLFLWGIGLFHILLISGVLMTQSFFNVDIGNLLRYNDLLITYFVIITISLAYIIYSFVMYYFMDNIMEDYRK